MKANIAVVNVNYGIIATASNYVEPKTCSRYIRKISRSKYIYCRHIKTIEKRDYKVKFTNLQEKTYEIFKSTNVDNDYKTMLNLLIIL